jgi:hypothetical protein
LIAVFLGLARFRGGDAFQVFTLYTFGGGWYSQEAFFIDELACYDAHSVGLVLYADQSIFKRVDVFDLTLSHSGEHLQRCVDTAVVEPIAGIVVISGFGHLPQLLLNLDQLPAVALQFFVDNPTKFFEF